MHCNNSTVGYSRTKRHYVFQKNNREALTIERQVIVVKALYSNQNSIIFLTNSITNQKKGRQPPRPSPNLNTVWS